MVLETTYERKKEGRGYIPTDPTLVRRNLCYKDGLKREDLKKWRTGVEKKEGEWGEGE